jgi:hypothetical protein
MIVLRDGVRYISDESYGFTLGDREHAHLFERKSEAEYYLESFSVNCSGLRVVEVSDS